jgi:hypothetical protein
LSGIGRRGLDAAKTVGNERHNATPPSGGKQTGAKLLARDLSRKASRGYLS